jgi:diguanylate cyclase (GGDEF)-like protein/PAS domain S-box-containing protein
MAIDTAEQFLQDADTLRMMLDNLTDGVYFTDKRRRILYWNKGAETISGFGADEVKGRCCADNILMHVDDAGRSVCPSNLCPLVKCFRGESSRTERLYLHHKAGHRVAVRVCATPIRDAEGEIIGGLETFHDISTELAALQEVDELRAAAYICPLTGVGNRRYCEETLQKQFDSYLSGKSTVGLLFFDVDNFKQCNDKYGHDVGDVVLKMVARTLSKSLRSFDFVGRWGGEEFVAILPNVTVPTLEATGNRMRALVEKSSASLSAGKLSVTVSVGATTARAGDTLEEFLARADRFMYTSKRTGKNRVTIG